MEKSHPMARHRTTFLSLAFLFNLQATAFASCNAPTVFSAESLVQRIIECNKHQQALINQQQAAQHYSDSSGHLDDPRLSLGIAPLTFGDDQLDTAYTVEISQSFPWPGVLNLRAQMAADQISLSQAQLAQHQVDLALQTRLLFARHQHHTQLLAINQQHHSLWQELLAAIRSRYSVGSATQSSLIQATQEQYALRQEKIELQASIQRDLSQLTRLGGFAQSLRFDTAAQLPNTELSEAWWQDMLSRLSSQPQLMGLNAKQQRKEHELELAEKDRYPSFNVYARYNRLWQNAEQRWLFGVGFNLPFDLGKRSNRERGLRSENLALEWERQDLTIQLREQLNQARSDWQEARDIHTLYQDQLLQLAADNLQAAQTEYQSGQEGFLTLLTAQRQLLDTARKAALAEHNQYAQYARLLAAAGVVSEADLALAAQPQTTDQSLQPAVLEQAHD